MQTQERWLNGKFGVCIEGVTPEDLREPAFRQRALELWREAGGLLAVRGEALAELAPEAFMDWTENFGALEKVDLAARERRVGPFLWPLARGPLFAGPDAAPSLIHRSVRLFAESANR